MTAREIRKAKFECDDGGYEAAKWLQEIAAQLAELNERNKRFADVVFGQTKEMERPLVRVRRLKEMIRG